MPYLPGSSYMPPSWLSSGHAQTIFPALFRLVVGPDFQSTVLPTSDGDEILLDRHTAGPVQSDTVVILSHGLEGHSRRKYMRGMCLVFGEEGWDSVCRNFRFCGGRMNRTPGMYHSGQTDDLHDVVRYCVGLGYTRVFLVGFSMGGNQVLKYLGEDPARVSPQVAGAAVFSVPCHLPGAARSLDRPENAVYMRYFLWSLRRKIRQKHAVYPDLYPLDGLDAIRTFAEFDSRYTAPVHGFASASDYWEKAACLPHLRRIAVPALLVNAKNDPFLSPECLPAAIARESGFLTLETPESGGHVGFTPRERSRAYWSETRAALFFRELAVPRADGA